LHILLKKASYILHFIISNFNLVNISIDISKWSVFYLFVRQIFNTLMT